MDNVWGDADVSRIDEGYTLLEVAIRIHVQALKREVLPISHRLEYGLHIAGYPDPTSLVRFLLMAIVQDLSLFVSTKREGREEVESFEPSISHENNRATLHTALRN